ncbi:MAG: pyruvate kinase [Anaerolineae bacterium]|nr:pyruvate kinase [Anaerolineae bacterium]
MLHTKIVCTIGPACREPAMLRQLIVAGMNVARLNFSHGNQASHAADIAALRAAAAELNYPLAILADLQGPKLRVGQLQDEGVPLEDGQEVVLTTRPIVGRAGEIPVQYAELPQHVQSGEHILLDDGLIELEVREIAGTEIRCLVRTGGVLTSNKGMNLPQASLAIPAITDKDRDDLRFALAQGVDWLALSFVRAASEVKELKQLIGDAGVPVIAKIEKPEALAHIEEIVRASDGIMVARGDLGIETSPEAVPMTQKRIIALCDILDRPVITATQMLDSMIRNPRPTRAEASDVANAVLDGTDAVMLSGETAAGKYPLRSVQTMARIVQEVERESLSKCEARPPGPHGLSVAEAVCHASCQTAADLGAAAIIAPTLSGYTARTLSAFRTPFPIVAVTPDPVVQRRLSLYWGVYPIYAPRSEGSDAIIVSAVEAARQEGFVRRGDTVVVTAGAAGSGPGTTNLMKAHIV